MKSNKRSPKLNLAIQYIAEHPEAATQSGNWLATNVRLTHAFDGITYHTWNTAKRLLRQGVFGDDALLSEQKLASEEAVEYLKRHPELHMYGGKSLAKMIASPTCSSTTWKKARKLLDLPPIDQHAQRSIQDKSQTVSVTRVSSQRVKTIIHIHVKTKRVNVYYGGQMREYRLKVLEIDTAIALYKSRGYKYTWLNDDVVLLTYKPKAKAA